MGRQVPALSMDPDQRLNRQIAEVSTLLQSVRKAAGNEHSCALPDEDSRYRLSSFRERQLACSFAFLSARTKDADKVTAVAIEEATDKRGLTIRIASNVVCPVAVQDGFRRIASILEQAPRRGSYSAREANRLIGNPERSRKVLKEELFAEIVALDRPKILSKLRSKHAGRANYGKEKPQICLSLSRAVLPDLYRNATKSTIAHNAAAAHLAMRLCTDFAELENMRYDHIRLIPGQSVIMKIIQQIYEFTRKIDLKMLLGELSIADRQRFEALPRQLDRLALYFRLSRLLMDASLDSHCSPLFQRITIVAISPVKAATHYLKEPPLSFDEVSSRYNLQRLPAANQSKAKMLFQKSVNNTGKRWKVHAEIGLVNFYDHHVDISPPRMICSSKKACHLCALFIQAHGRFQIPSTHGKVYEKWILPTRVERDTESRALGEALQKLHQELETNLYTAVSDCRSAYDINANESISVDMASFSGRSSFTTRRETPDGSDEDEDEDEDEMDIEFLTEESGSESEVDSDLAVTLDGLEQNGSSTPVLSAATPGEENESETPTVFRPSQGVLKCFELTRSDPEVVVQIKNMTLRICEDELPDSTNEEVRRRRCWVSVLWLRGPLRSAEINREYIDVDGLEIGNRKIFRRGAALDDQALLLRQSPDLVLVKFGFDHSPPLDRFATYN